MTAAERVAVAMTRQQEEAHRDATEEWASAMSYKIYLLEREVHYRITRKFPALVLVEKLRMFDRYWQEQKKISEDSKPGDKEPIEGINKRLLK